MKHFEEIAQQLIDKALKLGAKDSDVILSKGESLSMSVQQGEIDKYNVSGSQVVGIRSFINHKVGISYTESFDNESLEFAAKASIENAINTDENPYETLPEIQNTRLEWVGEKKESLSNQQMIQTNLHLESNVKEKSDKVQAVPYNGFSESKSQTLYMSSKGVISSDSEEYYSCYTSALIHDGSKNSMHWKSAMGRSLAELSVDSCVNEAFEHASLWLDGESITTGSYDVIFQTDTLLSLYGCFAGIFSAQSARDHLNPYRDKIGKKVWSDLITLKDLPKYDTAFFKHDFDSEAVKRKDLALVDNGVLSSFYHNTSTANYFNTVSTGHASRGARSSIGVSGTNLLIEKAQSDMGVNNGEYLEIHSLQGLHSGTNFVSGEFSLGVGGGYLCRDGKRVKPVKGFTLAGNFYELMKNVVALGSSLNSNTSRSFFAPEIRFSSLKVSGN